MKRITLPIVSVMMGFVIAGCDDDNNANTITPGEIEARTAYLRVVHGSSNAPKVNVNAAGDTIAGLAGVDYEMGSAFISLREGSYPVTVDAILPDMSTVQVLNLGNVELMGQMEYTVFAHGLVGDADAPLATAIIANPETDPADGNIRVQVLHASPTAPTVDLHITGAMDELSAPLATLGYGENTSQVEVPAGVYRVRLTLPGDSSAVAFDVTLPDLPAGADLFVAAVPNTGVPTSPVKLLVNDASNTVNAGATFSIIDDRTQSWVRVVHAAADAPAVDNYVNGAKVDALSNLSFRGITQNVPVDAGMYTVETKPAGADVTVISTDFDLMADTKYTVHAVGSLAAGSLEHYAIVDDARAIATESQVRITHGHPSVGLVDIYVTADGNIEEAMPLWEDVPFKASTGFVGVAPGEYNVTVTLADTKTAAIDTGIIMLEASGIYSALAVDDPANGNLVLMDDFVSE
ncbi:DUF4397 domain-containing protein [Catenovulum sp. SM1970]|uniref:DUF4397 domain-containing protein n=1 Tax=Marinifaba aquimaris TaxID=2741323 RepID=UPI00157461D1|nr:DUF4397 domain-containing protein [Marinifaba aquimaris]NTS76482.1 DUF4397 domain-containing protein [Marinifaba aquimaris]